MSLVPENKEAAIQFYSTHLADWTVQGEAIGLTPEVNVNLSQKTDNAQSAVAAAKIARDAARSATAAANDAVKAMLIAGSTAINAIRLKAQSTNDPAVYDLANLPRPKTRAPVAVPGTPYQPNVALQSGGSLKLTWKCDNPSDGPGVRYEIHRADGSGAMTHIGSAGRRAFVDSTIPAGSANVTYSVTAVRSTKAGQATQFNVQFGTGGSGTAGAIGAVSVRKAA